MSWTYLDKFLAFMHKQTPAAEGSHWEIDPDGEIIMAPDDYDWEASERVRLYISLAQHELAMERERDERRNVAERARRWLDKAEAAAREETGRLLTLERQGLTLRWAIVCFVTRLDGGHQILRTVQPASRQFVLRREPAAAPQLTLDGKLVSLLPLKAAL